MTFAVFNVRVTARCH